MRSTRPGGGGLTGLGGGGGTGRYPDKSCKSESYALFSLSESETDRQPDTKQSKPSCQCEDALSAPIRFTGRAMHIELGIVHDVCDKV